MISFCTQNRSERRGREQAGDVSGSPASKPGGLSCPRSCCTATSSYTLGTAFLHSCYVTRFHRDRALPAAVCVHVCAWWGRSKETSCSFRRSSHGALGQRVNTGCREHGFSKTATEREREAVGTEYPLTVMPLLSVTVQMIQKQVDTPITLATHTPSLRPRLEPTGAALFSRDFASNHVPTC